MASPNDAFYLLNGCLILMCLLPTILKLKASFQLSFGVQGGICPLCSSEMSCLLLSLLLKLLLLVATLFFYFFFFLILCS